MCLKSFSVQSKFKGKAIFKCLLICWQVVQMYLPGICELLKTVGDEVF